MSDNRITGGVRTFKPVAADKREDRYAAYLPEIECNSGDQARATDEAIAILGSAVDPMNAVYVSGIEKRALVHSIARADEIDKEGLKQPAGTLVLEPVSADWLGLHLGRIIRWKKRSGTAAGTRY